MSSELCKDIHSKYLIKVKGKIYCKKCDWGYLDTLNLGKK